MSSDRATAILALHEASRALQLAHRALVRLGDKAGADEVADMGADTFALLAELASGKTAAEVIAS
jgi:hypothetical protein